MEWWLLTFFITAILSLFIPIVPEFSLLLLILLISLFLIVINKFRLVAVVLFAFSWLMIAGSQYQHTLKKNDITAEQLYKQVHIIEGEIANIVNTKSESSRFNFLITHWQGRDVKAIFKVRLTWKAPSKALLQGQKWQLAVKLKPAHGMANIGSFNYQVWLRQQQIIATGYVKPDIVKKTAINVEKRNILLHEQISWRQYLYQKLALVLADETLGALILALGFGERGELTAEHWRVLSATATQHLIAISGLHIGIVAFASLILIRLIIRLLPLNLLLSKYWQQKLMQVNFRYIPILCSCFMAWYYAYLAGFSIPTLRALVMLLLFWSLKSVGIHVKLLRWLFLAIVIILLIWPLSLISASFWLSVSALVIIFSTFTRFSITPIEPIETVDKNLSPLSENKLSETLLDKDLQSHDLLADNLPSEPPQNQSLLHEKLPSEKLSYNKQTNEAEQPKVFKRHWLNFKAKAVTWLKTLVVMQLSLTLAMLPIAASLNYQLPLAAFLANVVTVPLMSITVIPLTLLAVIFLPINTWLSHSFVELALWSLSLIWQWLSYLSAMKWAVVAVSYQQIQMLLLFYIFIALALFFRLSKGKLAATLCLFIALIIKENFSRDDTMAWQLSVLDVGHGLAIIIEKNGHVFLYDTGASYPSGFNMADAAILPYIKYRGYQSIDGIIVSHNDNDHSGGLRHLREAIVVDQVFANDVVLNPDSDCISGQSFTWQGLVFEMLSPVQLHGNKNDDSCVVTISDGVNHVLLPGDISIKQERRLLNMVGMSKKLATDVLIAPHHGSKSSSSRHFLSVTAPKYAVFSTGYLNRWKMPSDEIQQRYDRFNIKTFNTAELGMVTFKFSQAMANESFSNEDMANANVNSMKANSQGMIESTPKAHRVGTIVITSYREDIRPYWFVN